MEQAVLEGRRHPGGQGIIGKIDYEAVVRQVDFLQAFGVELGGGSADFGQDRQGFPGDPAQGLEAGRGRDESVPEPLPGQG